MRRIFSSLLAVSATLAGTACGDELPTAEDGSLLPISARTVEISLPFEEFATNLRILGGYGTPAQLSRPLIARAFEGTLDARALVRYGPVPRAATVTDSDGASQVDTLLTYVGGRAVVRFDTLTAPAGPVTLVGGALDTEWDPSSATWQLAVDTVGVQAPWTDPGAGPVTVLDTVVWDPSEADSVVFPVDSATVNLWADTTDARRGLRVAAEAQGERIRIRAAVLRVDARPSVAPDDTVEVSAGLDRMTFVYDPPAPAPTTDLRVGGAPAWRTIFDVDLPDSIRQPNPACAELDCPFELKPEEVIFASLVLESRASEAAFRPTDSLEIEARAVLRPDLLPKSPVSDPLQASPEVIPPEAFAPGGSVQVSLPMTAFVQNLLRGETPEGDPVSSAVALLSAFEPSSFDFATFAGPPGQGRPFLRILLTLAEGVDLP